jgi:hypothetical protein
MLLIFLSADHTRRGGRRRTIGHDETGPGSTETLIHGIEPIRRPGEAGGEQKAGENSKDETFGRSHGEDEFRHVSAQRYTADYRDSGSFLGGQIPKNGIARPDLAPHFLGR